MWKNATPPPDYIITETKFGGAALDKSTGQMSDEWVEDGIEKLYLLLLAVLVRKPGPGKPALELVSAKGGEFDLKAFRLRTRN